MMMNNAVILSIGDELLIGQVVNTNASWLGARLTELGLRVDRVLAVGDGLETIRREIAAAAGESAVVIVSGGLGPTHDDMTREAICELLGCGLELDEEQLRSIERRFAERGIELNERSRRQAMVPAAARRLRNDYGSAPGLAFTIGDARVYALPGVPSELKGIFTDHIAPELADIGGEIEITTFLIFGPTESALADRLSETVELLDDDLTLAYLPSMGGIRLRAMRRGQGEDVRRRHARLIELIRERCDAGWIVSDRGETLPEAVGRLFQERGLTLAAAESCTGGMIGMQLTEVPGSSGYFLGGAVSYANSAKEILLGVDAGLIERHGAVSAEVAEAMAAGIRERLGADVAVGVTGTAGPGGGSQEKPVGTVWIAVASSRGTSSRRHQLGREREVVRTRSAALALDMARREALELQGADPASGREKDAAR